MLFKLKKFKQNRINVNEKYGVKRELYTNILHKHHQFQKIVKSEKQLREAWP